MNDHFERYAHAQARSISTTLEPIMEGFIQAVLEDERLKSVQLERWSIQSQKQGEPLLAIWRLLWRANTITLTMNFETPFLQQESVIDHCIRFILKEMEKYQDAD